MRHRLSVSAEGPVLHLSGRFTHEDRTSFHEAIGALAGRAGRRVVFDLAEVVFIDSAALGMLLVAREHSATSGRDVVLRGARGQVEKLIGMTRFNQMFVIEG